MILVLDLPESEDAEILTPQSGKLGEAAAGTITDNIRSQNVRFSDHAIPHHYAVDHQVDDTRMYQDNDDAVLSDFFRRPLKIATYEWTTAAGTLAPITMNPWTLYFTNPRVINRITNYNLLRCKLHLKFIINGNGFLYGRAMANYLPLHNRDTLTTNTAGNDYLVQLSQMPKVFLNPTTSAGGDIICPFFWYKNYLDIPDEDWDDMGNIFIRSINDLKHANGAVTQCTISVFAWAEDVQLSGLTTVEPVGLVPQSGEVDEANAKGIISGPATAIANVAGALKNVPLISPFAKATEEVAGVVSGIASIFGFCRPTQTNNPAPMKQRPISDLAVCNTPDGPVKLSFDHKQELTVDPRISGVGSEDLLGIKSIAGRESYLTTFSWSHTTAPETLLWNCRVTPVIWSESGATLYHFPACAMAAMPFKYWTGTMRYRFQIVSSSFHKGRLKFVFDPKFVASNEYNINYMKIVDISEENDFTISIGNSQEVTLLDHHYPGVDIETDVHDIVNYATTGPGNGVLGVYIVNELTVPNSVANNDIEINVYVSASDDFEVFVPDDFFKAFTTTPNPAMGLIEQSGKISTNIPDAFGNETDEPVHEGDTIVAMPKQDVTDHLNLVFTGESIRSFRFLLKRYQNWYCLSMIDGDWLNLYNCAFPTQRGNVGGTPMHQTALLNGYNYVNNLLVHWVTMGFQGWRGGMRWKALIENDNEIDKVIFMQAQREHRLSRGVTYSSYSATVGTGFAETSIDTAAANNVAVDPAVVTPSKIDASYHGWKGVAYTHANCNPLLEWELPYYEQYRFYGGKTDNFNSAWAAGIGSFSLQVAGGGGAQHRVVLHHAVAEDFQCYFWTGLPALRYQPSVPAAA